MHTSHTPVPTLDAAGFITAIEGRLETAENQLDPAQRALAETIGTFLQTAADRGGTTGMQSTGYFVYGPPGRGKTWLMTQLFDLAPVEADTKRQVHFHDFFRSLQQQFGAKTSTREAIDATLEELLTGTKLFFFDELHVHDPGSAALLNRLLTAIVEQGIPTLITSNYEPEGLLPDLMFHHVIEPGVTTIRNHFTVTTLDGGTDYRSTNISRDSGFASGAWLVTNPGQTPDDALSAAGLDPTTPAEATTVLEDHRVLNALAIRGDQIWFDFADLLQAKSVTSDFIDLAEHYTDWVLIGVPKLSQTDPASRQRFVSLIDVLVDRNIPLIVLSAVTRDDFVDIADVPPDLFRTVSRLALLDGPHNGTAA